MNYKKIITFEKVVLNKIIEVLAGGYYAQE